MDFNTIDNSLYLESDDFLKIYDPLLDANIFPKVDAIATDPSGKSPNPNPVLLVDPALEDKAARSASHRVAINLSCTTGQLSDIMALLAKTGLDVNIKIHTQ